MVDLDKVVNCVFMYGFELDVDYLVNVIKKWVFLYFLFLNFF